LGDSADEHRENISVIKIPTAITLYEDITAAHNVFAAAGSLTPTVTISNAVDGTSATAQTSAAVTGIVASATTPISATQGQAINNAVVATFSNTSSGRSGDNYRASINWGVGSPVAATLSQSNGVWSVEGSLAGSAVTSTGTLNPTVTITDTSNQTTASSSITGPTITNPANNWVPTASEQNLTRSLSQSLRSAYYDELNRLNELALQAAGAWGSNTSLPVGPLYENMVATKSAADAFAAQGNPFFGIMGAITAGGILTDDDALNLLCIIGQMLATDGYAGTAQFNNEVAELEVAEESSIEAAEGDAVVQFGPLQEGPLPENVVKTFRSGTYSQVTLGSDTTLYRVWGGGADELGQYWSRTAPSGPLQSTIDLALDPMWGNNATNVVTIEVPPGTTIYEGFAAPQGGLVGGGSQVYIPGINPAWVVPAP